MHCILIQTQIPSCDLHGWLLLLLQAGLALLEHSFLGYYHGSFLLSVHGHPKCLLFTKISLTTQSKVALTLSLIMLLCFVFLTFLCLSLKWFHLFICLWIGLPQLQHNPHENRDLADLDRHVILTTQNLPVYNRCSVDICWMNKWTNLCFRPVQALLATQILRTPLELIMVG